MTEVSLIITLDKHYRIQVKEYRKPTVQESEAMHIEPGTLRTFKEIYHFDTMSEAVHFVKEKLVFNIAKIM